jgi:putative tryptophan/tyrosine transport system substrate-binding protein
MFGPPYLGRVLIKRSDWSSAVGGKPDILCSFRAFPLLTHSGHPAVQRVILMQGLSRNPEAAMRRREFITLLGAFACPTSAYAQQLQRVRRVGVLLPFVDENDGQVRPLWPAFKQRMHDLGWDEGRNIDFDLHFTTQNNDKIRAGAEEIVESNPELIVVWSNPGLAAVKQATQTIPVVFALVGDPVASGLVASLAHPGGNLTGFQNFEPATIGKWLELLKEIAPEVHHVGVVSNQSIPANLDFVRTAQANSASMGVTITAIDIRNAADIEPALAQFAQGSNGGLVVAPNPLNSRNDGTIVSAAARLRLPAIYPFRLDAEKDIRV